jgi:hypothetical protein
MEGYTAMETRGFVKRDGDGVKARNKNQESRKKENDRAIERIEREELQNRKGAKNAKSKYRNIVSRNRVLQL